MQTAQPLAAETNGARSWPIAILLTLGFSVLFMLLRTRQYMAVDGALRCLGVFHDPSNRIHGNNHMLYPFWIWLWTHTAAWAGFATSDWLSFLRLSQAMNAFCAAAAIGILFTVLRAIAGTRYALLGSLQFGLATAVVMHGTNSAEPVTGLLFSMAALGVLIPALRSESLTGLFLVGVLLTLALASYQAMGLVMPLVAFACVCWPETRWPRAAIRLAVVGAGGILSVVAVYGIAYASIGIAPQGMVRKFLTLDGGSKTYGHFSVSRLLNVPTGLLRSLFRGVPAEYGGFRSLLSTPHPAVWILVVLLGLVLLAICAWFVGTGIVREVRESSGSKPLLWAGILLTAGAVSFPLAFWDPLYDKLWLLPLAIMAIASAFAFRPGNFHQNGRRVFVSILVVLTIVEAAVNIPNAIRDHVQETAHLNEAEEVAALVGPRDSILVDFDSVSMLWLSIWGYGRHALVLPGASRSDAVEWLSKAEADATASGGALFFVSVLDHDRRAWDDFLGRATGISYAEFECYRKEAVILRRYPYFKSSITVRRLTLPSSCKGPSSKVTELSRLRGFDLGY